MRDAGSLGEAEAGLTERVRAVWAEALGMAVADETDFFAVGGTSLVATRITADLHHTFGTRIPLRLLFDNARFDAFVAAVTERLRGGVPVPR